ncbi:MAG TPA: PQQ-dependent sugar dehydrogenase, partial [Candidatus Limnocylindrales bacterium]
MSSLVQRRLPARHRGRSSGRLAAFAATAFLLSQLAAPAAVTLGADPPTKPGRLLSETGASGVSTQAVGTAALPSGFTDSSIFTGLTFPTSVRFSPDGRVFVAEKSGLIKVFASLTATTPTIVADLRTQVDDYWDRGLLGFTLDPNFPTTPNVYVMYAYDAMIGQSAPRWNDACPSPPGPTTDGCTISGRLSRLTLNGNVMTGSEQVLINAWCQQYPSHSVGDLRFGPDGALYATAGDGAAFNFLDYGQAGGSSGSPTPKNPCGDPSTNGDGSMTPPGALGGALRSQSLRRTTGPVLLNGSLIRINPSTGAAMSDNPLIGSSDANARRIVSMGYRNPFRFTFRPGTNEVWIGDVGDSTWEEIDRVTNPLTTTTPNGGWPCYEGNNTSSAIHGGYQAANLTLCNTLYSNPTGLLAPYYAYQHFSKVISSETCGTDSSSISGLAFYQGGTYPSTYDNALFFTDHSRNCIWVIPAGSNGLPNKGAVANFVQGAANPVDLEIGPGGDLYYVDFEGGAIHRITFSATNHPPVPAISADPTSGNAPLTVDFDASGSSDPDPGDTLTYSWDLDGNGTFGDAVLPTASKTYSADGVYNVALRVTDSHGATATTTTPINVGGSLPVPVIDSPSSSLTWSVGDPIAFSGHATDGQGQAIPASGLTWNVILHHCPTPQSCHTHPVQTFSGVASGSVNAPDHEYPSFLELQLVAKDSANKTASTSVSVQPKGAPLSIATNPPGLSVTVGTASPAATPFTKTVIANTNISVAAPVTQTLNGVTYTFSSWSDGGAATHDVNVPLAGSSLTATYSSSSTTAYLSDLAYTVTANGWGPVEKDRSNGEQAAGDGGPLTLNGTVYAKG